MHQEGVQRRRQGSHDRRRLAWPQREQRHSALVRHGLHSWIGKKVPFLDLGGHDRRRMEGVAGRRGEGVGGAAAQEAGGAPPPARARRGTGTRRPLLVGEEGSWTPGDG
jgi:hypothetical protein